MKRLVLMLVLSIVAMTMTSLANAEIVSAAATPLEPTGDVIYCADGSGTAGINVRSSHTVRLFDGAFTFWTVTMVFNQYIDLTQVYHGGDTGLVETGASGVWSRSVNILTTNVRVSPSSHYVDASSQLSTANKDTGEQYSGNAIYFLVYPDGDC